MMTTTNLCGRYYTWNGQEMTDDRVETLKKHLKAQIETAERAHANLPVEDQYFRHGLVYAYREALRLLEGR